MPNTVLQRNGADEKFRPRRALIAIKFVWGIKCFHTVIIINFVSVFKRYGFVFFNNSYQNAELTEFVKLVGNEPRIFFFNFAKFPLCSLAKLLLP